VSSEIEIKGFKPSGILWLHQATGDALAHSVSEQELENTCLRKRVKELEAALNP
jgi:hypothetical protein